MCLHSELADLLLSNLFIRCGLGCLGWVGAGASLSCCLCVVVLCLSSVLWCKSAFLSWIVLVLAAPPLSFGAVMVAPCGCLLVRLILFVCGKSLTVTVAILAQGTLWAVAVTQAFLLLGWTMAGILQQGILTQ